MIEKVTVAKCLEFAIKTEEIGAELYQRLAARFASDRELHDLFEGLGRDEAIHRDQFQVLHDRSLEKFRDHPVANDQQEYVRAMSMSEIFSGPKGLTKDLESIKTRDDALERALQLEKATLGYYQAVREIIGADEALDTLIAVEKKHVVKVMQLMMTEAKFRGLADSY